MVTDLVKDFLFKNSKKRLNIHCVGDAMVDEYYSVKVNRISPEFPMPIMTSPDEKAVKRPGGVANVAYQFKHFNVERTLICFSDSKSTKVFHQHGLYPFWNRFADDMRAKLPIKRRFLDGKVQVKRHDIEKPRCGLKIEQIDQFHEAYKVAVDKHGMRPDVVIFSDYDKGFFYPGAHVHFPGLYPGAKTIVDPKRGPVSRWKGCNVLKLNAAEAETLSGISGWQRQARYLKKELECEAVVITFGGEKVVGITDDLFEFHPEEVVDVNSVVGAGDCFAAIFATAYGYGFSVPEAVRIAYRAGSVYVQSNMNRPVSPADLPYDRIVNPADLAKRDFKLVFTNGCFDILHQGHMETLKFAKSKGEKLVVAVNTDESVRRLKGGSRPVVPLEQRMAVLANLRHVDFVVPFGEDTPFQVIRNIKPDVLVKGGDYTPETIVGADAVPEVYVAPTVQGVSTSTLLDRYLQQQP